MLVRILTGMYFLFAFLSVHILHNSFPHVLLHSPQSIYIHAHQHIYTIIFNKLLFVSSYVSVFFLIEISKPGQVRWGYLSRCSRSFTKISFKLLFSNKIPREKKTEKPTERNGELQNPSTTDVAGYLATSNMSSDLRLSHYLCNRMDNPW